MKEKQKNIVMKLKLILMIIKIKNNIYIILKKIKYWEIDIIKM